MVRRLYALGTAHTPETSAENRDGSKRHRLLEAVWKQTLDAKRLWYAPTATGRMDGPPGSSYGLYALKYALRGTECEGMDQRIIHLASFDRCFQKGVDIRCAVGCGPVRLMLLSNGVLVTLSETPELHGVVIPCPTPGAFIVDAAAGESHYVLCDSEGSVYTWGWANSYGQLGRANAFPPNRSLIGVHEPQRLAGFGSTAKLPTTIEPNENGPRSVFESRPAPQIVAVACGRNHTVMLAATRTTVYTFGRGSSGQLGLGRPDGREGPATLRRVEFLPAPRAVPCVFGTAVRELKCASDGDFSMIVLESGELVVWGDNTTGAFGAGHCKTVTVPTPINIPPGERAESEADSKQAAHGGTKASSTASDQPSASRRALPGPLEPRRIKRLVPTARPNEPRTYGAAITLAATSLTHSAVVDTQGRLLTAGLRPIRLETESLPVNAIGPLGRRPLSKQDAVTFGPIDGIFVDEDDRIACGNGFTAYLMRRQGLLFLVGSIAVDGKVLAGGGEESHELFNIVTGVGRRVVDVVSVCNGGILMLVDEEE